jgi:hypothetical protein
MYYTNYYFQIVLSLYSEYLDLYIPPKLDPLNEHAQRMAGRNGVISLSKPGTRFQNELRYSSNLQGQ